MATQKALLEDLGKEVNRLKYLLSVSLKETADREAVIVDLERRIAARPPPDVAPAGAGRPLSVAVSMADGTVVHMTP